MKLGGFFLNALFCVAAGLDFLKGFGKVGISVVKVHLLAVLNDRAAMEGHSAVGVFGLGHEESKRLATGKVKFRRATA